MLDLKPNHEEAAAILATLTGSLQTARMWLHLMLQREGSEHPPAERRLQAKADAEARMGEIQKILAKVNAIDDYARQRTQIDLPEEDASEDALQFRVVYSNLEDPLDEMRWTLISELHAIEDHILPKVTLDVRGRGPFYVRLDNLTDLWAHRGGTVSSGNRAFVSFLEAGAVDVRGGRSLNVTSVVTRFGARHDLKRPPHRPKKSMDRKKQSGPL